MYEYAAGQTIYYIKKWVHIWRTKTRDIVLVDVNEDKAKGAAINIAQGISFHEEVFPF